MALAVRLLAITTALFMVLASSQGLSSIGASGTNSAQAAVPLSLPKGVKLLCDFSGSPVLPTGIYPGKGGAFVENYNNGNLEWCSSKVGWYTITTPPSGGSGDGYIGMAGIKGSYGLVLVLMSYLTGPGFWICFGATANGCSVQSTFITLPSSFCSGMTFSFCDPKGVALDKKLNIYYADADNEVVVKCTYASAYQSCSVIEDLSSFSGSFPLGIFRMSNGTIWVSDGSCNGYVWKNGALKFTYGNSLGGITVSSKNPELKPHVYVADTTMCTPAFGSYIRDLTDLGFLPTPFSSDGVTIDGLSTSLQFPDFYGQAVYSTTDA